MSWATIFGNLVTNRQVHALLCSDVRIRTRAQLQEFAKSLLKNGHPRTAEMWSKIPTLE